MSHGGLKSQAEVVDDVNRLRRMLPGLIQHILFEAAVEFSQEKRIMFHVRRAAAGDVFTADFGRQPDWLLNVVREREKMPVGRWTKTVEIKDLLNLEAIPLEQIYLQIVLRFETEQEVLPDKFHVRARQAVEVDDVDIFDLALEVLYAWADEKRIWLGV